MTESNVAANISEQSPSTARSGKFFFCCKRNIFYRKVWDMVEERALQLAPPPGHHSKPFSFSKLPIGNLFIVHSIIRLFMPHSNPNQTQTFLLDSCSLASSTSPATISTSDRSFPTPAIYFNSPSCSPRLTFSIYRGRRSRPTHAASTKPCSLEPGNQEFFKKKTLDNLFSR